jgi:nicotinic acid mononucleotide adenylyltransferase
MNTTTNPSPRRAGAFPGSFNPPTVAHLATASAARDRFDLDEVHLIVSLNALGKVAVERPTMRDRLRVLETVASSRPWLRVVSTDLQLLADRAEGYEAVIMGADKWHQIHELQFYGSATERDEAIRRLPPVAVVPRGDLEVPEAVRLEISEEFSVISSTAARAGAVELMCEEARRFDEATGAWTDSNRYERWLASSEQPPPGET